jgi:RNA polymerase sigma factor (sigma-70 family)
VNNKTDQEIINDVLAGNITAYHHLVSKYRNMVFTLVYNILLNKEDAEEIAQDTFVKAYTALKSFKGKSTFSTWLYRIAVNAALNKKKIKTFSISPIEKHIEDEEYHDIDSLLSQCENKDCRKYVQLALAHLKDDERLCITLYYLNELQVSEIQVFTGISSANIKVLLFRGRKNLYRKLKQLLKEEINNLI